MADIFDKDKRSEIMRKIKGKDTKPELIIRKMLFSLGYRYRLHRKDLPGKPDIVFPPRKKAIFINGCFWHGHSCKRAALPETNKERWSEKILSNVSRDKNNYTLLEQMGWKYIIVWQCEIKKNNIDQLRSKLVGFIEG